MLLKNNLSADFPILSTKINNNKLIYLDNAATTQKPNCVIESISNFYKLYNAPVNRGVYALAEHATELYNQTRHKVAKFINASSNEIAFTYGTTDSINIVANSLSQNYFEAGDSIILSQLEHHANLVVWQKIAHEKNLKLKFIPITADGLLDMHAFKDMLDSKTKLVSLTYISNVLGTHVDIETISELCAGVQCKLLVDAAQAAAHIKIDIKKIKPDFLVFSSHKMFGPDGLGVLYVNPHSQDLIIPSRLGGSIVQEVSFEKFSLLKFPNILEAGTQNISAIIGLGASIDYINQNIDFDNLKTYESNLCAKLINNLQNISGVKILGPIEQLKSNGHIVSFTIDKIHAHDVAAYLDKFNICVRAGHHCAQPLHKLLNIESSVRVSVAAYNSIEEIDKLSNYLEDIHKSF